MKLEDLKKASILYLSVSSYESKHYIATFCDVEYKIHDNYLYLFKENIYIGVFDLKFLGMEVEE